MHVSMQFSTVLAPLSPHQVVLKLLANCFENPYSITPVFPLSANIAGIAAGVVVALLVLIAAGIAGAAIILFIFWTRYEL